MQNNWSYKSIHAMITVKVKFEMLDEYCKFNCRITFGKCLLYNDGLYFSTFMYVCTTTSITPVVLKFLKVPIQES